MEYLVLVPVSASIKSPFLFGVHQKACGEAALLSFYLRNALDGIQHDYKSIIIHNIVPNPAGNILVAPWSLDGVEQGNLYIIKK